MKLFETDIVLENERVLLRPLRADDLNHLLPFAEQEPDLWTYSLISGATKAGMQRYMEIALKKKAAHDSYPFIVFDKKYEQYAGSTRYYDIQPHHQTLQLGYTWYGKQFQRTGLNTHCKYLMLSYAFEQLKMLRVEFRADATNQRSIAAMKRIGCQVEGILRSNCAAPDGRRDSIVLSILSSEWDEEVKKHLQNLLRAYD